MMRVALYFRVSTEDQTTEPQRLELLDYCRRRGWTDVREYSDKISGAKFTRLGLDMLMAAVRRRAVDAVLVVKLDRLGRSLPHMAQLIAEMDAAGVALIATSQGIDTSQANPAGRLQMNVLLAVAQFERELIRERTLAGLAAARKRGNHPGRPKFELTPEKEQIIRENAQKTLQELAEALGCSVATAHRLKRKIKA